MQKEEVSEEAPHAFDDEMSENAEKNEAEEEDFKSAKHGLEESEVEKVVSDHLAAAEDLVAQSVSGDKSSPDPEAVSGSDDLPAE
jgi:hypothetical protein